MQTGGYILMYGGCLASIALVLALAAGLYWYGRWDEDRRRKARETAREARDEAPPG